MDSVDASTDIALTAGSTFWVGYVRETTAVGYSISGVSSNLGVTTMIQEPDDSNYDAYNLTDTALALPATVTAANLVPRQNNPGGRICLAIK